jgi:hypothetical protein
MVGNLRCRADVTHAFHGRSSRSDGTAVPPCAGPWRMGRAHSCKLARLWLDRVCVGRGSFKIQNSQDLVQTWLLSQLSGACVGFFFMSVHSVVNFEANGVMPLPCVHGVLAAAVHVIRPLEPVMPASCIYMNHNTVNVCCMYLLSNISLGVNDLPATVAVGVEDFFNCLRRIV